MHENANDRSGEMIIGLIKDRKQNNLNQGSRFHIVCMIQIINEKYFQVRSSSALCLDFIGKNTTRISLKLSLK